jgi:hypothetical protein
MVGGETMTPKTAEEAYEQIASLPVGERLRLVEKIAHDLSLEPAPKEGEKRYSWLAIAGIAPNLLAGEDAQEWVSRTRREGDERRRKQWEPNP